LPFFKPDSTRRLSVKPSFNPWVDDRDHSYMEIEAAGDSLRAEEFNYLLEKDQGTTTPGKFYYQMVSTILPKLEHADKISSG